MELNRCYVGDCRDTLRAMAAAGVKVQTCVTSPPYWGLRDYGIPPSIWGGVMPGCVHDWGDELSVHRGGPQGETGERADRDVTPQEETKDRRAGRFCKVCGAWLGALGLEPDYRDFLVHMVEVFGLVRDVLADDGTLWLNMGDSYASASGGGDTYGGFNARYFGSGERGKQGAVRKAFGGVPRLSGALKTKDLCLMPARLAIALQDAGWWVRSDIIWHKPNPMPESATDRPTKSHEYVYLLSKSERYYYDAEAIKEPCGDDTHARYARGRSKEHKWADGGPYEHGQTIAKGFEHMRKPEKVPSGWDLGAGHHDSFHRTGREAPPGVHPKSAPAGSGIKANESFSAAVKDIVENRNKRTVWTVATEAFADAHFATFPRKLIEPCILAGAPFGGVVLDIFMGSGTTAEVAENLGRQWIGCEINPEYVAMQSARRSGQQVFQV